MPLYNAISLSSLRSRSSRIRPRHRSVPLPEVNVVEAPPAAAALEAIISPKKSHRKLGNIKSFLTTEPKMFSKIFKGRNSTAAPSADANVAAAGSTSPVLPELEPHDVSLNTWEFSSDRFQPRTLVVKAFGRTGRSSPSAPSSSEDDNMSCHSEQTRTSSEGSSTLYNVEAPSTHDVTTGSVQKFMPNKSTVSFTGYIFNPETNKFEAVRMPLVERERSNYTLVSNTTTSPAQPTKIAASPRKFPLTDPHALDELHNTITVAAQSPKRHLRRLPAWHGHNRGGQDGKTGSIVEPGSRFLSPKRIHQVGLSPTMQNIASVFDVDSVVSLSEFLSRRKGPLTGERPGGRGVQVLL